MAINIGRRELVTLIGGAAVTWPLAARAQQSDRVKRVGVLSSLPEHDPESVARRAVLEQALQALGWIAGRNLRIDYRWTSAEPAVLRKFAAELVALAPDVIDPADAASGAYHPDRVRSGHRSGRSRLCR